jgi:outer membrane protein OmpA-like peptidoglycan-associated protein
MTNPFDQLNLRPQERRILVVVGLIIFIVLNFLLVTPLFGQLDAAEGQLDKSKRTLAKYESEIAQAAELQRQLDEMNARVTDRGLVLTLGDVLFTSGKADLRSGATGSLDKLAAFLVRYPERTVTIEGHTDDVGSEEFNMRLSGQRAESVKFYLAGHGVSSDRLAATGTGESDPVADNGSATGRQQNRRVQVHISDAPVASR